MLIWLISVLDYKSELDYANASVCCVIHLGNNQYFEPWPVYWQNIKFLNKFDIMIDALMKYADILVLNSSSIIRTSPWIS